MPRERRVSPVTDADVQRHLEWIRDALVGHLITLPRLRRAGFSPRSKGKWGHYNERLLGLKTNSNPAPDFGELGELKTTVRDRNGRFRESLKICMAGHDPLAKLARVILVVARDQNDAERLEDRVVRNEEVVLLEPTTILKQALLRDVQLLGRDSKSKETYFLETRTAGAKGTATRAFYLKGSRLQEYVENVPRTAAFRAIQQRLRGLAISHRTLQREGYQAGAKGRFGNYVRSLLPRETAFEVRTGVIDGESLAKEDVLVCREKEDPVAALRNVIYVPMRIRPGRRGSPESRVIADVMYLAPSELVVHVLEHDRRLVKRNRASEALFLRLKTHYSPNAPQAWSWYLKSEAVRTYAEVLRNQPV